MESYTKGIDFCLTFSVSISFFSSIAGKESSNFVQQGCERNRWRLNQSLVRQAMQRSVIKKKGIEKFGVSRSVDSFGALQSASVEYMQEQFAGFIDVTYESAGWSLG